MATHATDARIARSRRTPVQLAAAAVGVVFLLVGVLGFVPGITTDGIGAYGHESDAHLLGVFQVSVLHNVVHLLFGAAGLALARSAAASRRYFLGGGAIYLVLVVYGLAVAGRESVVNVVPVNAADNWLHLALGAGMLAAGLVLGRRPAVR